MNDIDWDALLTESQMAHAQYIAKTESESPRFRDTLINEVLISMPCPPDVEREFDSGFLREYAGYVPPVLGRLLAEHLTRG